MKSAPNGDAESCPGGCEQFLNPRSKMLALADAVCPNPDWKPFITSFTAGAYG